MALSSHGPINKKGSIGFSLKFIEYSVMKHHSNVSEQLMLYFYLKVFLTIVPMS